MTLIYFIVLDLFLTVIVNGNHFLGGTITWHPLNASATGTPIAIVIIQTYSWTYSLMHCTRAMIASNSYVPSYGGLVNDTLECIYNCGIGSTGYSNISVIPRCTDFSIAANTTVGQRLDTVYLDVGDDFAAAFRDSSWRPLATDANAAWAISTHIIVKPRSDTGLYNNAPVATVMSPINIPYNKTISIDIPVADADGDVLRCRWSTKSNGINECRDICPPNSFPPNTFIYSNCTIIITGLNISDWYAVAIMVEDFIDSSSVTPLSSTPVQFLVQVISASSCTTLPEIIGIPAEQSCTPITIGQNFTSQLIAQNNCGVNVTIVDILTLSFAGMVSRNITKMNSTTYYKNLTWTPTIGQLGYQVMCAMAFDSQDLQSMQYCFKFYVTENEVYNCPGETRSITSPNSTLELNLISWPIVGSILGLFVLALLALCCYFCSYLYQCSISDRRKGTIVLYHIEQCIDPKCLTKRTHYSCPIPTSTVNTSPWAIRIDSTQIGKNIKPKSIVSHRLGIEEMQEEKNNRFKRKHVSNLYDERKHKNNA